MHQLPQKRPRPDSPNIEAEKKLCLRESCSLDSLPDGCIYEILRRLPSSQERSNSACVSKRWLMLLSSISSSKIISKKKSTSPVEKQLVDLENTENYDENEELFENTPCLLRTLKGNEVTDVSVTAMAVRTCGGLENLEIYGSHPTRGLTDVGLSSISRCCLSLKGLSLLDVPFVTDAGLSDIAKGCPMLETLDLRSCIGITTKGLITVAENCPNLVSLTLDHCINIRNDGIDAIGRMCSELEGVSIKNCDLIGDQGISGLIASASASLAKLKLQHLSISDLTLASVGHFGDSITELHLSNLQNVGERGFLCMSAAMKSVKLKTIVITSCHGMTDTAIDALRAGCPSLKQLRLRKCYGISDKGLTSFFNRPNELDHLHLEECNHISLHGVHSILIGSNSKLKSLAVVRCMGVTDVDMCLDDFPSCKSLQSLMIRDCPGLTSTGFSSLGNSLPNLTNLQLRGLAGLTDAGLFPFIMNKDSGITYVNLSGCVNLSDKSITALLEQHGYTLQTLKLNGCSKLTDQILLEISVECTVLEQLDMSGANVTDYGTALLASARHLELHILSFSGCSKMTSRCLPLIGNMGPALVALNLQHCGNIQATDISDLEKTLSECRIYY